MVVYYCDKCGLRVAANKKIAVQLVDQIGNKSARHLCDKCFKSLTDWFSAGQKPVIKKSVEEMYSMEAAAPIAVSKDDVSAVVEVDTPYKSVEQPSTVSISVDEAKVAVESLGDKESFMFVTKMPEDNLSYFQGVYTSVLSEKAFTYRSIQILLMFYRGFSIADIRKKFGTTAQTVSSVLYKKVSADVYSRWFNKEITFDGFMNFDKVGSCIAGICSDIRLSDVMADVGLDIESAADVNALLYMIEYYSGLSLSERQRKKFVLEGDRREV